MRLIIKNATIVNEGKSFKSDVLVEDRLIKKIALNIFLDIIHSILIIINFMVDIFKYNPILNNH